MGRSPLLVTIILNTDRRQDTLECLQSLTKQRVSSHQIVVLDNQSTDGSVQAIRHRFPNVKVLQLEENRGYAGNNNVGIKLALEWKADWILLLNEDVILDDGALEKMLTAGQKHPQVGIVGPLVLHNDEPTIIQTAGGQINRNWLASHRGQNLPDSSQYDQAEIVDWVSGCAIMVRRQVVEQVGALDERYFYYWEETEWCLRAGRHGWQVLFVPEARIWHKGVQRNYEPSPSVTYYWTRNWLLTLSKHRAPLRAWLYAFSWIGRNIMSWSLKSKWRDKRPHRNALLQGSFDFLRGRWGVRPS